MDDFGRRARWFKDPEHPLRFVTLFDFDACYFGLSKDRTSTSTATMTEYREIAKFLKERTSCEPKVSGRGRTRQGERGKETTGRRGVE